jgi:cephalosporin hydroxylase
MYPRRTLLLSCAATALVTAGSALLFVETAYPSVRGYLQTALLGRALDQTADFRSPANRKLAAERYARLIAASKTAMDPETLEKAIAAYARLNIWQDMSYLGVPIQKYPNDLIMFQRVIAELKPDFVIETGTNRGGSAIFFAHILDGLGLKDSRVLTVDLFDNTAAVTNVPLWRQYVEFTRASSTDPLYVNRLKERVSGKRVLVTLDSDHRAQHVSRELEMYAPLVAPGGYLVVEDTLVDGIPLDAALGPGPMAALQHFLATGGADRFERDERPDALLFTQNRGGWLRARAR